MNARMNMKTTLGAVATATVALLLSACGGGGGHGHHSPDTLYYPYETVYGDICSTMEPTPGCTFSRSTGERITVEHDPDYDRTGFGSDDLWFVNFDANGNGKVFNEFGHFVEFRHASEFPGYVGSDVSGRQMIGVGTTGLYWEQVNNGRYWLGRNEVLYSGEIHNVNYGQAINNQSSGQASDTNFAALNSDTNKLLVKKGAEKLVKEYGFKKDKATAVASALNSWAVASAERGKTSTRDMDKTFKATFGVQFSDALAAVKDLAAGDKSSMQGLTNRSAAALGLKPDQAQDFMKRMYKKALSDFGYDTDSFSW